MEQDPIETVIEDVEDIFSPKPGGMIDRHRQERARREAAQKEAENAAERVEENASFAVKVAVVSPEIIKTNAVNVPAAGAVRVLFGDPYRYRATLTATANVTLAETQGKAISGIGYQLAAAAPPLVVNSRAELWASAAGAAVVSVLSEIYAPETK